MDGRLPVAEKALKNPGLPLIGHLEEVIFADKGFSCRVVMKPSLCSHRSEGRT